MVKMINPVVLKDNFDFERMEDLKKVLNELGKLVVLTERKLIQIEDLSVQLGEKRHNKNAMTMLKLPTEEDLLGLKEWLTGIQVEAKKLVGMFGNKIKPVTNNIDLILNMNKTAGDQQ